jgi:zinc D-Ala-D-Ala carboxypeptidase
MSFSRRAAVAGRRALLGMAATVVGAALVTGCGRRDGGAPQSGDLRIEPATEPAASPEPRGGEAARPAPTAGPAAGMRPVCLVTKQRGVGREYVPSDLVAIPTRISARAGLELREPALDAFVKLVDAAARDGHVLFALSAFRSYQDQERVLAQEVAAYGKTVAERQVAPPGHSEHQLGLAVDVTSKRAPYDLREAFGQEPEGRWLAQNAAHFGYVISYPAGKEAVTGYVYEPWHIRYVGTALAEQVAASGLTLTEYLPRHNLAGPCS